MHPTHINTSEYQKGSQMNQADRSSFARWAAALAAGLVLAALVACSSTDYGGTGVDSGESSPPPPTGSD